MAKNYYDPKYRLATKFAVKDSDGMILQNEYALEEMSESLWPDKLWSDNIPVLLPKPFPLSEFDKTYPARYTAWKADVDAKKALYITAIHSVYPNSKLIPMAYCGMTGWYEIPELEFTYIDKMIAGFVNSTILNPDKEFVMHSMVGIYSRYI